MKTELITAEDMRLRALLQECKVTATLPPRFQEEVWRRIAHHEEQRSILPILQTKLAYWISMMLPRPALAVSYMAVLLTVGASIGWAQARQEKAHVSDEMRLRYVQSIDPYQSDR